MLAKSVAAASPVLVMRGGRRTTDLLPHWMVANDPHQVVPINTDPTGPKDYEIVHGTSRDDAGTHGCARC